MIRTIPDIWLGSERELFQFIYRHDQPVPDRMFSHTPEDEDPLDTQAANMIERYEGGVAVLNISGALTNDDDPDAGYWGETTYPSISRALGQVLEDDSILSIVLAIASPGGNAQGVEAAGQAIKDAAQVKPIVAFADPALSAGMWLASAAQKIYSSPVGQSGSVGAISTAISYYERLKNDGVEAFVARSAPKKALLHPAEPMSAAAKASLQSKVDRLGDFFIEAMVANRPGLSQVGAKDSWASGESFFAAEALQLGLIDGIKSGVSQVIAELAQLNQQVHNPQEYSGAPTMKRLVLSAIDEARISAGIPIATETSANPKPQTDPVDPVDPVEEQEQEEKTVAASAAPEVPLTSSDDLSAYLKSELAELKAENKALRTQLAESATAQVALSAKAAEVAYLRPVAEAAVSRLSIGLGHRPTKLVNVPSDLLAEQFEELQAELMQLPVGRKSAAPEVDDIEASDEGPETLAQHRLRLVPGAR